MGKPDNAEQVGGAYFSIGGDTSDLKKSLTEGMQLTQMAFNSMKASGAGFGQTLVGLGAKATGVGAAIAAAASVFKSVQNASGSMNSLAAAMGIQGAGSTSQVHAIRDQVGAFSLKNVQESGTVMKAVTRFINRGGAPGKVGQFLDVAFGAAYATDQAPLIGPAIAAIAEGRGSALAPFLPGMRDSDMYTSANISRAEKIGHVGERLRQAESLQKLNLPGTALRTAKTISDIASRKAVTVLDLVGPAILRRNTVGQVGAITEQGFTDITGQSPESRLRRGIGGVLMDGGTYDKGDDVRSKRTGHRRARRSTELLDAYRSQRTINTGRGLLSDLSRSENSDLFPEEYGGFSSRLLESGVGFGQDNGAVDRKEATEIFKEIRNLLRERQQFQEAAVGTGADPRIRDGVTP